MGFWNRVILKVTVTYLKILMRSQGLKELPGQCCGSFLHEIPLGKVRLTIPHTFTALRESDI